MFIFKFSYQFEQIAQSIEENRFFDVLSSLVYIAAELKKKVKTKAIDKTCNKSKPITK